MDNDLGKAILDTLSDDERKEIVVNIFKDRVASVLEESKDVERVFSNISYSLIGESVDSLIGEDSKKLIKSKTKEIIDDMGSFSVFRNLDSWGQERSLASRFLDEAVTEYKPILFARVKKIMEEYDLSFIDEGFIVQAIAETIGRDIFKKADKVEK